MKRIFRFGPRTQDVAGDVQKEIEAHLEQRAREFEEQGMDPAAARLAALQAFGDRDRIEKEVRALQGRTVRVHRRRLWWGELGQDLRSAARGLRRSPLFTAVALVTLAMGIGANTAAFSVLRSVVLRPLPYPESERVVQVWTDHTARGRAEPEWLSPPQYFAIRDQVPAFEHIAAYQGWGPNLTGEGTPEALVGGAVSGSILAVLGTPPALGRDFTLADDDSNAPPVVILTDELWRRRFAADPGVVGRTVQLNGVAWTIVGVMPPSFRPPVAWEIIRPLRRPATSGCNHGCIVIRAIARLAPGVSLEVASEQAATALGRLVAESPEENARIGAWLIPLHEQLTGPVRPALLALLGAVAFVLVIACVNLASLTLVRSSSRAREFGVRAALGAGRGRIIRQLLTESLLLALVGGGLGFLLAVAGTRALGVLVPPAIRDVQAIAVDGVAVGFMVVLTIACGVLSGLLPALQGARSDLMAVLRSAHGDGERRTGWGRRALVTAELAIALVLLIGAGLLLRTLVNLQRTDLGFRTEGLVVAGLFYPSSRYPEMGTVTAAMDGLLERLRAHPAIRAAEVNDLPPLTPGGDQDITALADGIAPPPGTEVSGIWYRSVTPGAMRVLGMRLVAGREFGPEDRAGGPMSAIITEEAARRLWPGEDPLGHFFASGPEPGATRATIVGVVADVRHDGPREPLKAQAFLPIAQLPARGLNLLVEPSGDQAAAISALREELRAADPDMPLAAISSFQDRFADVTALPRHFARIVGGFAAAAILLALIGVYGLMASVVGQRQREIGVRMALGADPARMVGWLVGEGARLTAGGVLIGVLLAMAVTRVLGASLHGVEPLDALTFVVVPVILAAAALLACWIPARRARRVDPATALRAE
jgi:predicted permease